MQNKAVHNKAEQNKAEQNKAEQNYTESGMICIFYVKIKKSYPETITLQKMLSPQTVVY